MGDGPYRIEKEVRNDKVMMTQPHSCDEKFEQPEHLNIDDSNGNLCLLDKGN
jgi:hypothetical protein